jgi:hypothetical protein
MHNNNYLRPHPPYDPGRISGWKRKKPIVFGFLPPKDSYLCARRGSRRMAALYLEYAKFVETKPTLSSNSTNRSLPPMLFAFGPKIIT